MELGALHPISGRQWQLADDQSRPIWPDACLVVPFGAQVKDDTGKVVNQAVGTSVQGGWTVTSTLEELELTDLVQNTKVTGVTAVWAAGPGGDTPALHVLGDDPFGWLTPHLDAAAGASTSVYPPRDQWFGTGPVQMFSSPLRFGEMVIAPHGGRQGRLLAAPLAWLQTRMLQAPAARLSFSHPSGLPIVVDELSLGVLYRREEHREELKMGEATQLSGGWFFAMLGVDVGGGADAIDIPYGGSILWVRYRRRPLPVETPERITLQPGHYELSLSGQTTGEAPSGFSDAAAVPWSAKQRFWVEHPPSLRPYVRFSTVGDDRLFGPKPGFDPTLPGLGFPAHRDYLPVVRFCVPYVKGMFPALRLRLDYPDDPDVVEDVPVVANAAEESTLPAAAIDWKTAHGGSVAPDDEVAMTSAMVPGAAALRLSHVPAAGPEFELDSWGVQISRFADAATHLAWPGTCLTRFYRHDGPQDRPACPTLVEPSWSASAGAILGGALRAHDLHRFELERPEEPAAHSRFATSIAGALLHPIDWLGQGMPDEYGAPPGDWPLDASMAELARPLDAGAAQRFLLFLWRSGVRLTADPAAPALGSVGDPVAATTVEAVCDDQDRPLALWLRTPEPLDWRRVHVDMTLRHVSPDSGCPTSYANRSTMAMTVDLLPSPDGSGALLLARLDGAPTRLPRGEVTLKLRYEPSTAGLATLRPRTPLPSGREAIALTFLQPLGRTWPVKPSGGGGGVPHVRLPQVELHPPHFGPPDPGPLLELIRGLSSKEVGE